MLWKVRVVPGYVLVKRNPNQSIFSCPFNYSKISPPYTPPLGHPWGTSLHRQPQFFYGSYDSRYPKDSKSTKKCISIFSLDCPLKRLIEFRYAYVEQGYVPSDWMVYTNMIALCTNIFDIFVQKWFTFFYRYNWYQLLLTSILIVINHVCTNTCAKNVVLRDSHNHVIHLWKI